jgi:hypothetical protein
MIRPLKVRHSDFGLLRGEDLAREPDSLAFRFAVILALAVIIVAITTWASHHKRASAVPSPTDAIYRAQHLNLF